MVIFVADAFKEHYVGGAELTTAAIMSGCLLPNFKILSHNLSPSEMEQHKDKFWIFGNFNNLSEQSMLYAIKNLSYCVVEYDYKFCKFRSPGKHIAAESECNCENSRKGKLVSVFIARSKVNFWMSQAQKEAYRSTFPFIQGEVLSSVFSNDTLDFIESLDVSSKNDNWIILNSNSWIKGASDSTQYAKNKGLPYELVWDLDYKSFLKKLASSRGLIFLPRSGDTCPRLVIEAKLLGCELILNNNVQHKDEDWFQTVESCREYLRSRVMEFWRIIGAKIDGMPRDNEIIGPQYHIVSPFYNAESYLPQCIQSIKRQKYENFQCTLIDDMSTDNSYEVARQLTDSDDRFRVVKNTNKKFALHNIVDAISSANQNPEDVIILLDADDWFSSDFCLNHLNMLYSDDDCWMTYGSYVMFPHAIKGPEPSEYPKHIIDNNLYRSDVWRASHLRTFRFHLWGKLDTEDLKDQDGNYYKMAYDQAIMLPLIEMSSERCKYVPEIMHVYNKANPLNVDKIKAQEQKQTALNIRKKSKYKRV